MQPCWFKIFVNVDLKNAYTLFFSLFQYDGQCECRQGFGGRACDQCEANFWGDPNIECKGNILKLTKLAKVNKAFA